MIASEETDLPQPDSPTIATTSPRSTVIGDAFDRADGAARGLELHMQVAHLEQRRVAAACEVWSVSVSTLDSAIFACLLVPLAVSLYLIAGSAANGKQGPAT